MKEVGVGGEAEGTRERTRWRWTQTSQERIWSGRAVLDGNGRRRRAGEHDGRRADEVKEGPFKQALPFYSTVFRKKKNLLSLLYPMIDV